ncbi:BglII/BstYI family type II restriction endonuclease [Paenibacillus sp. 23TSA30-6]|uniref:BglII/BstYI family type II restriction endonuclease n=1 Tax=Paenibacillus sp. 23TSA30-6 TaxID=2546104 RepID=UPI0017883E57|nr:BglII/BstYI family type II restriction endonuclease [Paenibacillus sp. 23TSA30-6]MBE0338717.1 hypothetical protein [Paenibacillus sp. 23TSA30-6]
MPKIIIADEYEHMRGKTILKAAYPELFEEILWVLQNTNIPMPSKTSREKTKSEALVFSGKDFNKPLSASFKTKDWKKRKIRFTKEHRYGIEVDFTKGLVGIEVQFGKYSFVHHDFNKFLYLFKNRENPIDVGVEIVPVKNLQKQFYTGPASFESVIASLKSLQRNDPPVPLWIIGIDLED